ncbi:Cytochrome P450 4V2 like protein [Argiope bruennichi]|uniref:Cytochrome P450 4V2 like protein n=1 Tax=Argiope bruennichi TaxID=94029 RepID=A0A8T0FUV3_ARGBR|nr:Cytochrome P450 4V2 like protein [Argiope bruennichi]
MLNSIETRCVAGHEIQVQIVILLSYDIIRFHHLKKLPGNKPHFLRRNFGYLLKPVLRKRKARNPNANITERIVGTNLLFQRQGLHCFWVGPQPVVSLFSPELLEIVLGSTTSLEKSFEYAFLKRMFGSGLIMSSGSKWTTRRKLLAQTFHFRILEDFLPTFNDQALFLAKKIQLLQHKDYVDILPLITLCTLDIICD